MIKINIYELEKRHQKTLKKKKILKKCLKYTKKNKNKQKAF